LGRKEEHKATTVVVRELPVRPGSLFEKTNNLKIKGEVCLGKRQKASGVSAKTVSHQIAAETGGGLKANTKGPIKGKEQRKTLKSRAPQWEVSGRVEDRRRPTATAGATYSEILGQAGCRRHKKQSGGGRTEKKGGYKQTTKDGVKVESPGGGGGLGEGVKREKKSRHEICVYGPRRKGENQRWANLGSTRGRGLATLTALGY